MNKIKRKAYSEILEVMEKHETLIKEDYQIDIMQKLRDRLKIIDISEDFGIDLKSESDPWYIILSDNQTIYELGPRSGRTIGYSDDDRQPEDEMLYVICFPTGPYVFSQDYPSSTFSKFFNELKSFKPKYIDSANKALYFTKDKAKEVHDNYKAIFDKYKAQVDQELKERRIANLKKELEELDK